VSLAPGGGDGCVVGVLNVIWSRGRRRLLLLMDDLMHHARMEQGAPCVLCRRLGNGCMATQVAASAPLLSTRPAYIRLTIVMHALLGAIFVFGGLACVEYRGSLCHRARTDRLRCGA